MVKQLLLAIWGLTARTAHAFGAEIPSAAFEAWANYRSSLAQRGYVIEEKGTNGTPHSTVYRWSSAGASMETDHPAVAKVGFIAYVRNQDYAFKVDRAVNMPWTLQDLVIGANNTEKPETVVALLTREDAMPALWGMAVQGVLLPDAIDDGLITVESVRETSHLGKPAVEVTIRGDSKPERNLIGHHGSLILVPAFSWMITEARLDLLTESGRKGTEVTKITYAPDTANIFASESMLPNIPVVISHSRSSMGFEGQNPTVHDVDLRWKVELPHESQFRLPQYGIPEPAVVGDRWTRYVFYVVIGAVAIILAAALLARLLKLKRQESK
jgi:hypothetical protein